MQALPGKLAAHGPIMQLAYVPRDFDATLDFWIRRMGVGPFFTWDHIEVDQLTYRGRPSKLDFSVALSYWGDIQIELIRQHDDAPSIYRDWNSDLLHHVQVAVPDYDAAMAACEAAGFPLAMEGRGLLGSPGLRFAYCDLGPGAPAGFVEFAHRPDGAAGSLERLASMKDIVSGWDGSDPVRPLF